MKHIEGIDRDRLTLMPDAIEDYITEDNPIRFLDAYVGSLNLKKLGFPRVVPEDRSRPPYHPGDLLRLYLYGYLFAIHSSRALEREANCNLEVIRLLKRLAPDFKTIADFRKTNGKAIRNLCRDFFNSANAPVCMAANSSPSTDPSSKPSTPAIAISPAPNSRIA